MHEFRTLAEEKISLFFMIILNSHKIDGKNIELGGAKLLAALCPLYEVHQPIHNFKNVLISQI